jgi:hypothetical protein
MEAVMRLSRDDILKADDIETEEVEVPAWGGTVLVRGLSGKERDNYESSCMQDRGKQGMVRVLANIRAKLVVRCLVDEDGNRLFADADANALGEKSAAALDQLFDVAARLSRLSDGDIEELGKDSAPVPPAGSASI